MRLELTGRNIDITPPLRQQLNRRFARLERRLRDSAVSAQVVLSRERFLLVTDITLHVRGDNMLTGVGAATTWPLSFKEAVGKIEQQGTRVKEKWETRRRRAPGRKAGVVVPIPVPAPAAEALPKATRVVRMRGAAKLMDVDSAAARLDTGDEAFVVFRNEATGKRSVLVRRRDGHFGLIEPEA
jgi:putative sigma-54 modulation protein